ncbi:hypothetical protein BKA69DRAFT_1093849 [Paraphysoderma sedebokerense]|nr:hypothetical protein BKA69DRAFT_1093849 [Paraphysoderma sedebokerense]
MEDYNTATLPHVKYYDIEKWDREQRLKRQRADLRALQDDEEMTIDFSRDEENIRKQHRAGMTIQQPTMTMSTEQVLELKRIQEERVAADKLRKMGYKPSSNLGIRYESQI